MFSYELQSADEFISGLSEKPFVNFLKRKGIYDNVLSLVKNNLEFKKGFQITPQQKQQAQQLYSQYLDTIFPNSAVRDIVYHGTNKIFDVFSKDALGATTGAPSANLGFFFASSFENAEGYSTLSKVTKNTERSDFYKNIYKPKIDEFNKLFTELSDLKYSYNKRKQSKVTLIEKLIEFINNLIGKKELTLSFKLQKVLDKIRALEIEVDNINNTIDKLRKELLSIDSREYIVDEGSPRVLSILLDINSSKTLDYNFNKNRQSSFFDEIRSKDANQDGVVFKNAMIPDFLIYM